MRSDGVTAVRVAVVAANAGEVTLRAFIQVDGKNMFSLDDTTIRQGDSLAITLPDPVVVMT